MLRILKVLPLAVILAGIALLAGIFGLYARTEQAVIGRHNENQLLLVRAVGSALSKEIEQRLSAFGFISSELKEGARSFPPDLERQLAAAGFEQIVVRGGGEAHRPGITTGQVLLSEGGVVLPVLVTAPNGVRAEAQLSFRAFSPLIEGWNRRVGGRLWLLDDEGRLIYSKLHPDMLARSALGGEQSCLACHRSFQMEGAMVAGQSAVVEHQVADRPRMLVYFAPVEFGARRWSLAMSDPQGEVIAVTRRGFLQASLLTALFLALVVAAGIGLIRTYQQKIDAERRAAIAENRAKLEARMMRAEQLAAIGKMTAQIAHEINTPLASISLNVTYVLAEIENKLSELPADVSDAAGEIQREVERLKSFTGECLKLTRIHTPQQFRSISLTNVVRGFLTFISREAKRRNVHLEAAFEGEAVSVRGDGDLLRQVLLNLTRNAFDAMPSGGLLEITLFRRDGLTELAITDSGPGVAEEQREKIFDAFFTSKPEGTGLGLAVVRRIVEQHAGQIACVPAPQGGARFVIRLPLAEDTREPGELEVQNPKSQAQSRPAGV